jgi:predicted Zn-dependent protease
MMDIQIGQSVVAGEDFKGDSVTLWSDTTIQGGGGSAKFDSYGTPGGRICLISKNHLKQYLADKRYADYLNVPVTGELGNVEVEPGSVSFKKLMDPGAWGSNKIYQLTAFSAFEPNPITGAFSAEIRAGYEITPKGKTPIKGGSVSGIIQRDLLDCYLSKERVQRERYFGPKGILFKKLTIAGK